MTFKLFMFLTITIVMAQMLLGQQEQYPSITDNTMILQGDKGNWDAGAVHTFSIVEADKEGYKYWAYYGLDHYGKDEHIRKGGLARSNDLINWKKYDFNPIIASNCRWPTVVIHDGIFYMFYAEYNEANDSRIVMASSKNGIDFNDKTVVVPYAKGEQNQNPFIYLNKKDADFYLFYYNGTERAKTHKKWNVFVKKSEDILELKEQPSSEVLSSDKTLAAPSIAYFNDTYYLLVEEFDEAVDEWVTNAFYSNTIDKNFRRVDNNPILSNNDAYAFQHVFNDKLYVSYSHCLNLKKGIWNMRIILLQ